MKRWMIVGFEAGAALFGYPPVLVAATGLTEDNEVADWVADVQRYVDAHAGTVGPEERHGRHDLARDRDRPW